MMKQHYRSNGTLKNHCTLAFRKLLTRSYGDAIHLLCFHPVGPSQYQRTATATASEFNGNIEISTGTGRLYAFASSCCSEILAVFPLESEHRTHTYFLT